MKTEIAVSLIASFTSLAVALLAIWRTRDAERLKHGFEKERRHADRLESERLLFEGCVAQMSTAVQWLVDAIDEFQHCIRIGANASSAFSEAAAARNQLFVEYRLGFRRLSNTQQTECGRLKDTASRVRRQMERILGEGETSDEFRQEVLAELERLRLYLESYRVLLSSFLLTTLPLNESMDQGTG